MELLTLETLVKDFAEALVKVDAICPTAMSKKSKRVYDPGIGPHAEEDTVKFVVEMLEQTRPELYEGFLKPSVLYPGTRKKCDLCYGINPTWEWAVEVKTFRILGNNGKSNDNMFLHLLSPYDDHRSALTDCKKLINSSLGKRKAILIYGFETFTWPLETAIRAFEHLALSEAKLSHRHEYPFSGLKHDYHKEGKVFAWELIQPE